MAIAASGDHSLMLSRLAGSRKVPRHDNDRLSRHVAAFVTVNHSGAFSMPEVSCPGYVGRAGRVQQRERLFRFIGRHLSRERSIEIDTVSTRLQAPDKS